MIARNLHLAYRFTLLVFLLFGLVGNTLSQSLNAPVLLIHRGNTVTVKIRYVAGANTTNTDFVMNYDDAVVDEANASINCASTRPQLDSFNCIVDTINNQIKGIGVNLGGAKLNTGVIASVKIPVFANATAGTSLSSFSGNFAKVGGATTPFTKNWKFIVPDAPARPTGIKATDGTFTKKVRVTFNTVPGATVYRVFRCLTNGQTCGNPIGFPKNGVFDDSKAVPGTVYFYRVRACTKTSCGLFSVANTGYRKKVPARATDIRATDGTLNGRVRVTFNLVPGATVYRVFRCPTTGPACGNPVGFPKTGTYDDTKGAANTKFYYRVRACTTTACGLFSVANPGHHGTLPALRMDSARTQELDSLIEGDAAQGDVAVPVLNDFMSRWLLILLSLGMGLLVIHRDRHRVK